MRLYAYAIMASLAAGVVHAQVPPTPPPAALMGLNISMTASTSSSNVLLPTPSSAFPFVEIINTGAVEVFYTLGTSNGVTATTSNYSIPGGTWRTVWYGSNTYIAAITASSSAALRITQVSGMSPLALLYNGFTPTPPPPTCTDVLDFSVACNSQYIPVVM